MISLKYTIYIDESGDAGLGKIRDGNSGGAHPYMTMCACIVPNVKENEILAKLSAIQARLNVTSLHTNKLSHAKKVFCAREICKLKIRLFGVASNKRTLRNYASDIKNDSGKYYNKCAIYLLEKVGGFLIEKEIAADDVSIVFEKRNHDYSALLSYIKKIKSNPQHPEARKLLAINTFSISFEPKKKTPLFFLPDFGAHALFQCFNKSEHNLNIPEPRYLLELRDVFHRNEKTGEIGGTGIKYIQRLSDLDADEDVETLLRNFYVSERRTKQ